MATPEDRKVSYDHGDEPKDVDAPEASAAAVYTPGTDEEKKLIRKIDLLLLPQIWLMYLNSYMDRTNIGNARIAGMDEDLDLDSNRYSVALVVFFVSYVVFEVPSNMILSRTRPSIYLPGLMAAWGVVTIGMGFVKDYQSLVALRFVVGLLEAGFAPGVLLLISSWYKKKEQSQRFAVYISAAILSGAFGGIMAGAIADNMEGAHGIRGWRWLFIIGGLLSVIFAAIAVVVLPDFPATTSRRKFTERERDLAILRLQHDEMTVRMDDGPKMGHWTAFKKSLANYRTWILVVGYMAIVGSSTLSYFYPTLVHGLGYNARDAQYMTIPIFGVAFVFTAITGFFADRNAEWRGIILAAWLTVSLVCAAITCGVYNFTARYVLLVILASGLWAANALSLSYASVTFVSMPDEIRGISLAFVNAMGNLAQIYGAYLFPSKDEPKYIMGFAVISAMCFTGIVAYLSMFILLRRKKENQAAL
ncbi:major facilitator superfamily domain-containing protein [Plectosphaerella cucumerina]|uniref:Major facilitator superfamily domain-containing protein n=1 Tax=Plectosphaerella cucumerina TaxID=40658 RepID=A0A8K0TJU7_9PEZI|nr:major facilitator superfamily domain-containing protein [Plectosphaerella cucumerina]